MQHAVRSAAVVSSGLSAGVIAAIVVGAVAGLLLIIGMAGYVFWLRRRKKAQRQGRDVAKGSEYGHFYSLGPPAMAANLVASAGTGSPREGAASARSTLPPTTASTLHGSTPFLTDMREVKDMRVDQRSRADSSETATSSKTAASERAGFPYQHAQQETWAAPHHADLPARRDACEAASIKHWSQGMQFWTSDQEKAGDNDRHRQDPMKRMRIDEEDDDDDKWSQMVEGRSEGGTTSVGGDGRAEEARGSAADDMTVKEHRPETDKEYGHMPILATTATTAPKTVTRAPKAITAAAVTRPRPASRSAPRVTTVAAKASPPRSHPTLEGVEIVLMAKPQRLSRGFAKIVYTTSPLPSPCASSPVSPNSPVGRGFSPTWEGAAPAPPLTASCSPTPSDKI